MIWGFFRLKKKNIYIKKKKIKILDAFSTEVRYIIVVPRVEICGGEQKCVYAYQNDSRMSLFIVSTRKNLAIILILQWYIPERVERRRR